MPLISEIKTSSRDGYALSHIGSLWLEIIHAYIDHPVGNVPRFNKYQGKNESFTLKSH